jgi:hypothetical protein
MDKDFTQKEMARAREYLGELSDECNTARSALSFAAEVVGGYATEIMRLQQENARLSEQNAKLNRILDRMAT